MNRWTKEQQEAISDRGNNLLLSAAAGSGKTAVLVERIVKLIMENKVSIENLLVVTFTNAAASEMRERISNRIIGILESEDEEIDKKHLRKQLSIISSANISTIHSFCIEIIRENFQTVNIDPSFRIGDSTEVSILKLESIDELFDESYEEEDGGFLDLVEIFSSNKNDNGLREVILSLYEFILSRPHPTKWLRGIIENFNVDMEEFQSSPLKQNMNKIVKDSMEGAVGYLKKALDLSRTDECLEGYTETFREDLTQLENLYFKLESSGEEFYRDFLSFSFGKLKRAKKGYDERTKDESQSLRNMAKDIIADLGEKTLQKSDSEYLAELNAMYPHMERLCSLIERYIEIYSKKKREISILDFSDLEHLAIEILQNGEISKLYRDKFEYVFIDEYQDSNIVQETIIGSIKRESNMFMVGDVKQSIYRFRLADPSIFISKYKNFRDEENVGSKRIDLSKNFRSRKNIIDSVNFVFKNIMSEDLGEISYDESAYLYQGREFEPFESCETELNIVEKRGGEEDDEDDMADIEVEARLAAKKIKELLEHEIYDEKLQANRRITYKDIVILFRSPRSFVAEYVEALSSRGIPVYADINFGYFENLEVSIFIDLLKVIDNKRQDINLVSVMRSPIFKFDVEELARIRKVAEGETFFDSLSNYVKSNEDELSTKVGGFLDMISKWKSKARYMKLEDFIWMLMDETGYYDYCCAMRSGRQRVANLKKLADYGREFEKTSMRGLFNFIKYIEKIEKSSGDVGSAKILGENENLVRIMSIHKSKGLEFPVVIIAGLGKRFNMMDMNKPMLFHKELGLGPKYCNLENRVYRDTIYKNVIKWKIKMESLSEEMRILYVGLTRAKDKLVLFGSVTNTERRIESWKTEINNYSLSKAMTYMDWLGPLAIRHKDAREIIEEPIRTIDDESRWSIKLYSKSDVRDEAVEEERKEDQLMEMLREIEISDEIDIEGEISKKLDWRYGYDTSIPPKLSVTQMMKMAEGQKIDESFYYSESQLKRRPKFMDQKEDDVTKRGNLLHLAMERIDLSSSASIDSIRSEVSRLVSAGIIEEEDCAYIDVEKIYGFFKSALGKRVLRSSCVKRETPFNYREEIVIAGEKTSEKILVQGIVDLYFYEGDEIILVDYKSHRSAKWDEENLIKTYSPQIRTYRNAIENILKKKVKESYIYFFETSKFIKID